MSLLRWLGLFGGAGGERTLFGLTRVRHLLGTTATRRVQGTTAVRTLRFEG